MTSQELHMLGLFGVALVLPHAKIAVWSHNTTKFQTLRVSDIMDS